MTAGEVETRDGRCSTRRSISPTLADCDLIIEAVFEKMDVKKEIFEQLDSIAKPGAILASNTSYLDIDEIAGDDQAARGRASACTSSRPPTS